MAVEDACGQTAAFLSPLEAGGGDDAADRQAPRREWSPLRRAGRRTFVLASVAFVAAPAVIFARFATSGGALQATHLTTARAAALTALWTPSFGAVSSERVRAALFSAFEQPGAFIGLPATIPFVEEAIITSDIDVSSSPVASLAAGSIQVQGLQYQATPTSHKIRAKADQGWITVIDMDTLVTLVDSKPWPRSCQPEVTYEPGTYVVVVDEMPMTGSQEVATHEVLRVLNRGDRVEVTQVVVDETGEKKFRGQTSDGGWVTIQNLKSCQQRMMPLRSASGASSDRQGSFMVIGDWGWDPEEHININTRECQETIALRMLQAFEQLGDVKFIINVGDSFYPDGLTGPDDPNWQAKWRDVFDEKLRSVPWYSVYGNHDLHLDRCACTMDTTQCAQINFQQEDLSRFYMPDTSYLVEHPELGLEIIALDTNGVGEPGLCKYTTCPEQCQSIIKQRYNTGLKLFQSRLKDSRSKNWLVFSHYPTDMLPYEITGGMRWVNAHNVFYFGGHRHTTDNTTTKNIGRHQSWVVGGGGGWSCEGPQGFVVGEIDVNYNIRTIPVYVDHDLCCGTPHPYTGF